MKTQVKLSLLLILAFSFIIFAACSGDSENAVIRISVGDVGLSGKAVGVNQLTHTIALAGPTGTKTFTVSGAGAINATVVAGTWNISVTAYYGDELYAVGSSVVDVKAGKTTSVSVQMTVVWSDAGGVPQDNGEGSLGNPFKVYDVGTLQKVGSGVGGWGLDKNYVLTQDIDMSGVRDFQPIGTFVPTSTVVFAIDTDLAFTGTFNGNGRKILNLVIGTPTSDYQGLFGCIGTGAIVNGVSLAGSGEIAGNNAVGGVVAVNAGGTVSGCTTVLSVSGTVSVGCVVGLNFGAVENCSASAGANGDTNVGGVVGENLGTVGNCNAEGGVSGNTDVGGVVGLNIGTVKNCFAVKGEVTGNNNRIGGVVGSNQGTVEDCYATGDVSGDTNVGGVVGHNFYSGIVENCHAEGDVTCNADYAGGVVGYNVGGKVKGCYYAVGIVTGDNAVGGVVGENDSDGWVENCHATGNVEGTGQAVGGVVGNNQNGTVKGCYFAEGEVTGSAFHIGGVAGSNHGMVEYCYATGNVNGTNASTTYAGGVVGYNEGTVKYCYAEGSVSVVSGSYVGGVVGQTINGGEVKNCYATGGVQGNNNVGGVAGSNLNGTVENCYARGAVSANNYIGGVVGSNNGDTKNCVALNPSVVGSTILNRVAGDYTPGSLDNNYAMATMTVNSFPLSPSTDPTSLGGCDVNPTTNLNDGTKGGYNNQTFWQGLLGWDFEIVWKMGDSPTLRNMPQ